MLANIVIPDSVNTIGVGAFYGCSGLESITLPFVGDSKSATTASKTTVFGHVFGSSNYMGSIAVNQSVGTYYIPELLTYVNITGGNILDYAFYGCSMLTEIILPEKTQSVNTIGTSAFYGCTGLSEITIPGSINRINNNAFQNCNNIEVVNISNLANWITMTFGNMYSSPLNSGAELWVSGQMLVDLVVPDSVSTIGAYVFYGCTSIQTVEIPSSVTSIGAGAFGYNTGIVEIYIPATVTSMGSSVFVGCTNLETLTVPFIGASASDGNTFGYIFGNTAIEGLTYGVGQQSNGNVNYQLPVSLKNVTVLGGNIPNFSFKGAHPTLLQ